MLEQHLFVGTVTHRLEELVFLKALERSAGSFLQGHLGAYGHVAGHAAAQPGGVHGYGDGFAGFQHGRITGVHLEPVGLHGFHVQHLVEAAAAHFEVGVPVAGGVIGLGGDVKTEEAVGSLAGEFAVERAGRGIHLQGGGMGRWKVSALVGHDGGHVQGISRAPHAAFSVNEGLDALLNHFSAHVEAAHGTLVAAGYLEVGGAAAGLGHHGEGFALDLYGSQALAVGLCRADALQLIVIHFQLGTGNRLGGDEVRGSHPQLIAAGIVGHQTQVAGEQLHGRESAGIHIIGRLFRILGILPIVVVPVVVIVPVVGVGCIPYGFIGLGRLAAGRAQGLHGLLAAIQALVLAETDPYTVNGPGLLLEQTAQVYAVRVPLVQVPGGVQGNVSFINQAAAAAQAVAAIQVVFLQEHQDVLLIHLDHAHFHGAQIHGAEGENEVLPVRQDVAPEGNDYGGLFLSLPEDAGKVFSQTGTALSFQAFVQGNAQVSVLPFISDGKGFAVYLEIVAFRSAHFHQTFGAGVGGGLAKDNLHCPVFHGGLHNAEGAAVVGLLLEHGLGRCAALDGDAEVKGLGCPFYQLAQCKAHLVHLSFLEGSFGRDKTHGLVAVPLDVALDGGLEAEQAVG